MSDPTANLPARHANGRFGPGNPGRRAGSRNRASHRAMMAIIEDFETYKALVLERLRTESPGQYFNTLTRLLPTMLTDEEPQFENYSSWDIARMCAEIRRIMVCANDGVQSLREVQMVLAMEPEYRDL